MADANSKLWPYTVQVSLAFSLGLLISMVAMLVLLRSIFDWPRETSETIVYTILLAIGAAPLALAIFDSVVQRGGVIQYRDIKLDFSQSTTAGLSGITMPANIAVHSRPLDDSSTSEILNVLGKAVGCDVVVIDLEDGQAWWETRLLVLLAGAVRLTRPQKVAFVAKDAGRNKMFQGWSHPHELLPLLLDAHPQYRRSYYAAQASAEQWKLVEPAPAGVPGVHPLWLHGLAAQHASKAFDIKTGLPNLLLAEQLLASDLGQRVEHEEAPKKINLVRLEELFRPVLHTEQIDETWPPEQQLDAFFSSQDDYLAITRTGQYATLVSRLTILSGFMKTMMEKNMAPNRT